jgi:hypothetical protein
VNVPPRRDVVGRSYKVTACVGLARRPLLVPGAVHLMHGPEKHGASIGCESSGRLVDVSVLRPADDLGNAIGRLIRARGVIHGIPCDERDRPVLSDRRQQLIVDRALIGSPISPKVDDSHMFLRVRLHLLEGSQIVIARG